MIGVYSVENRLRYASYLTLKRLTDIKTHLIDTKELILIRLFCRFIISEVLSKSFGIGAHIVFLPKLIVLPCNLVNYFHFFPCCKRT